MRSLDEPKDWRSQKGHDNAAPPPTAACIGVRGVFGADTPNKDLDLRKRPRKSFRPMSCMLIGLATTSA